jgi:predicted phosphoribosyltransferase
VIVLNEDVVAGLGLEAEIIRRVTGREGRELARREQLYREGRPMADPAGRTTIGVDDGLATGSSIRAAILALRRMKPARMVPAAPASTCEELGLEVDDVVCHHAVAVLRRRPFVLGLHPHRRDASRRTA